MLDQQRNVFRALAQRRHVDRDDGQAEVQILAEVALLDFCLEVLVRRRDHAHVDVDRLRRSQPLDLAFLKHAQHFGLRLQAHVADFVEEDRAAVGLLELPDLPLGGAGERALLVAEQLRLDELFRNRRAVDLHEALAAARADAMDRARDELLADAALALQQHGRVRRARLCRIASSTFAQRRAVADHLIFRVDFLPQRAICRLRATCPLSSFSIRSSRTGSENGFSMKPERAFVARLEARSAPCHAPTPSRPAPRGWRP